MRRVGSVAAAIVGVVLLCGASPNTIPEKVAAHMKDMADMCRQVNGKPLSEPIIEQGNLAAGLEFWAIDEAAFRCEGAESLFSGSAGSVVVVYVSAPSGDVKQVFADGAYGMTIDHRDGFSKIWLGVSGQLCGQKGYPTHAEAISCDRPLRWDANAQKLDFAPLSEARFPGPTPPEPRTDAPVDSRTHTVFSPANGPACKDYSKPEFGSWVCPGPGGFAVAFMDEGNLAGLTIAPARSVRKAATTAEWLGASKVFGERVQWIVREGVPKAAVIRIWRRKDVDDPTEIQELAIYAIDGAQACERGSIDIHRPRANELALAQAEQAVGLGCPAK
jgi:hypothetical protein